APRTSPEVGLPRGGALQDRCADAPARRSEQRRWHPLADHACSSRSHRELVRARNTELSARLQNPHGGKLRVVVSFERRADERLKLRVLKDVPPCGIGKRGASG